MKYMQNLSRYLSLTVAATVLAFLSGCAIIGDASERAAKGAGSLVKGYCDNITVPEVREKIRERVNHYAAPNAVVVQCAVAGPALVAGGNSQ